VALDWWLPLFLVVFTYAAREAAGKVCGVPMAMLQG
jgi:hypothetical protein